MDRYEIITCEACEGSGVEVFGYWGYEPGCGHGHMMDDERPCGNCRGAGEFINEYELIVIPENTKLRD